MIFLRKKYKIFVRSNFNFNIKTSICNSQVIDELKFNSNNGIE